MHRPGLHSPVLERSRWHVFDTRSRTFCVLGLWCALAMPAAAQGNHELAKQAQNPVASLISVPFQNNANFGVGPESDLQYVLNVQPVVPFHLSRDLNLITRTIIPVIHQPILAPGLGDKTGLGDITASFFLSPARPGKILFGIGPIVGIPTATDDVLGQGKLNLGPTAVALTIRGPWVIGTLVNQLFSVAGDSDRRQVSQMLVQPFVNLNFPGHWYLVASPIITADWKAADGQRWTVPVGGGVGKILRVGRLPINTSLQAFYNVEHPDPAADWSGRFQFQFLFPK